MPPSTPNSPCIGLCRLVQGKCIGCQRSIEEISQWGSLSSAEKMQLLQAIEQRRLNTASTEATRDAAYECIGICEPEVLSGLCQGCGRRLLAPSEPQSDDS